MPASRMADRMWRRSVFVRVEFGVPARRASSTLRTERMTVGLERSNFCAMVSNFMCRSVRHKYIASCREAAVLVERSPLVMNALLTSKCLAITSMRCLNTAAWVGEVFTLGAFTLFVLVCLRAHGCRAFPSPPHSQFGGSFVGPIRWYAASVTSGRVGAGAIFSSRCSGASLRLVVPRT